MQGGGRGSDSQGTDLNWEIIPKTGIRLSHGFLRSPVIMFLKVSKAWVPQDADADGLSSSAVARTLVACCCYSACMNISMLAVVASRFLRFGGLP